MHLFSPIFRIDVFSPINSNLRCISNSPGEAKENTPHKPLQNQLFTTILSKGIDFLELIRYSTTMTVKQLENIPVGSDLDTAVNQSIQENNSVIAGCNVHWIFRGSCVDFETGKHGIRHLITRILTEAQAVFPPYAGNYRESYLAYGLTVSDITAKIRAVNGYDKYPDQTIADNLCTVLKGIVGCIQMFNDEDRKRPANCKRPRKKWYLIAK
jgi:hypothetical protein